MTWWTDDRRLYWQQRELDARQAEAKRKMKDRREAEALIQAIKEPNNA